MIEAKAVGRSWEVIAVSWPKPEWNVVRQDGYVTASCGTQADAATVCSALNWREQDDVRKAYEDGGPIC